MQIEFNWPDYLIPFTVKHDDWGYVFDLFINSILFINDDDTAKRITRIVADLTGDDSPIWRWELPQPALLDHLAIGSALSEQPEDIRDLYVGSYLSPKIEELVSGANLKAGEQAILRRFPVRFTTHQLPDSLVIRVFSGTHLIGRRNIRLQPVSDENTYCFPVEGIWQVANNFDNLMAHRQCASREFAIDLIQLSSEGMIRMGTSDRPEDFICFGQDVHAMASGTVIEVHSKQMDNDAGVSVKLHESEMAISPKQQAGNYVLIEHETPFCSFYSHLRKGSVQVTEGDTVTEGQVIGQVGNSGNSSTAHLHVQLNKGSNPFGSRSYPIRFNNLHDLFGNRIPLILQNYSIVHTGDK
jgi:Peptidase family M23